MKQKALHFDIKKILPSILLCDLNDREFSITIDALTNKRFYKNELKKMILYFLIAMILLQKKFTILTLSLKASKRTPTSYFVGHGNTLILYLYQKI